MIAGFSMDATRSKSDSAAPAGAWWPTAVVAGLWSCLLAALIVYQCAHNGGRFIYALDDAYIHMATAKHFAADGVWGVTPFGFTSAVSSILWPGLVAAVYQLAGVNELTPLVLCVLIALILILVAGRLLAAEAGMVDRGRFLLLGAAVLAAPLHTLVLSGMEHPLQLLLLTLYFPVAGRVLSGEDAAPRPFAALCLLAALLCTTRYESLFLVAVTGLLLLRRSPVRAVPFVVVAVLPICLYGWWSVSQGWHFLPNPVRLKGSAPSFATPAGIVNALGWRTVTQMVEAPIGAAMLLGVVVSLAARWRSGRRWSDPVSIEHLLFLGMLLLQLQLSKWGHLYRYEAGLVFLFCLRIVPSLIACEATGLRWRCVLFAILLIVAVPFLKRMATSQVRTLYAPINIHDQQYQMGRFLAEHYNGAPVAANDIGAINFLADIHCLDVWGLSSLDVADAELRGELNDATLARLLKEHRVTIAVTYEDVLGAESGFLPCGKWTISNNWVCARDTVWFYAADEEQARELREKLHAFAPNLPRRVTARVYATGEIIEKAP